MSGRFDVSITWIHHLIVLLKLYLMFITFSLTSNQVYILDFAVKSPRFSHRPLSSTSVSYCNIDVKNCSSVLNSSTYHIPDILAVTSLTEWMMEIHLKSYLYPVIDAINQDISNLISSIFESSALIGGTIFTLFEKKIHLSWAWSIHLYEFFSP